jgi:CBS domain-containing protein
MLDDVTISMVIQNLDKFSNKIALVVNTSGILVGTISDGDVRRGMLKGLSLDSSIASIIHANPITVTADIDRDSVLQLMAVNKIQQIPIVDVRNHVVGMHFWD